MLVILLLVIIVVFDFAAVRWGTDSRDGFESAEWERRRNWNGFDGK
jgi:hypothetical protein